MLFVAQVAEFKAAEPEVVPAIDPINDKLGLQGIKELRRLAIHHIAGSTLL